ncbi:MAG: hypothetical protein Q8868_13600 [Bacteroidota bacterium]|nr:hypothetical protein [Bacteroidota bacterium]
MLKIITLSILMIFQQSHSTMTSIHEAAGSDSLNVVIRLNYDDFLRDYQQTINDDVELKVLRSLSPFPINLADSYINLKISIYINKRHLAGKLLNIETAGNDVILNILYHPPRKSKNITVRNDILTGLYSNVENLTIIRIGDFETGKKFTKKHNEETFVLD